MTASSVYRRNRLIIFIIIYLAAYFAASWMDLSTTTLGLTKPGVSEKNVFAINGEDYSPKNAWILTIAGAIIMTACALEAFRSSHHVEDHWLKHPVRSFSKIYFNPWSEEAIKFTPIHFLSLAIAFPIFRILAALNNLAVYWYGIGPIGEMMEAIAAKTSPPIGFTLTGFLLMIIITIPVALLAAKIIRSWKITT